MLQCFQLLSFNFVDFWQKFQQPREPLSCGMRCIVAFGGHSSISADLLNDFNNFESKAQYEAGSGRVLGRVGIGPGISTEITRHLGTIWLKSPSVPGDFLYKVDGEKGQILEFSMRFKQFSLDLLLWRRESKVWART